ncbi:MAG TPA: endolytic transglycosylase MltG [Candidatus Atribacteria bacterium]|nr:endolytic transglycosylase MltG [Candidatus Atribacteria bacterium]HPT77865.1 endolytic transglycosylase MltG [Candidatus Atribacteria bacterium]
MPDLAAKSKKASGAGSNRLLKKIMRQLLIYLISLSIVVGTVTIAVSFVYNKYIKPVDPNDNTLIKVEVPMGSSIDDIAEILYENGLIRSTGVFKIMVDLSNKANKMQAGKYELSRSMTIDEMIDKLMTGRVTVTTVKITIREGDNLRKIAQRLENEYNLDFTQEEFLKAAKNIDRYIEDYPILKNIPKTRYEQEFPLEGYLFPETYYVFADSTPEQVIRKMLTEFEKRFTDEMRERAESLGMSIDNVVTLASIIQSEGKNEEFEKISAVFHNRLKIGMRLESCATVGYALNRVIKQFNITSEDKKIESPYNTYKYNGLPIGPISSPGEAALLAALNPYEEFMDAKKPMLYFVLMDPEKGLHAFNSSYEDHVRDTNKYSKLWK